MFCWMVGGDLRLLPMGRSEEEFGSDVTDVESSRDRKA